MPGPLSKPPVPTSLSAEWPRIPVDQSFGSPLSELIQLAVDQSPGGHFAELVRIGDFAGDGWIIGPDGPDEKIPARALLGYFQAGLLHLLELGVIDIDTERLDALQFTPAHRESNRPADQPLNGGDAP